MDDSELEEQARFDRQQQIHDERDQLLATLKHIHELAAEDLRVDRVFVCHSHLYAIEAVAGTALARIEERVSERTRLIRQQQRGGTDEITAVMVSREQNRLCMCGHMEVAHTPKCQATYPLQRECPCIGFLFPPIGDDL